MSNNEKKRQPTSTTHFDITVQQTFRRSMTRKNPQTGKSNYPTLRSGIRHIINNNYSNNTKDITKQQFRQIDDKTNK